VPELIPNSFAGEVSEESESSETTEKVQTSTKIVRRESIRQQTYKKGLRHSHAADFFMLKNDLALHD
jgi:hypothetical protein